MKGQPAQLESTYSHRSGHLAKRDTTLADLVALSLKKVPMLSIDSLLADLAAEGVVTEPCQLDNTVAWGEDDRAFIILEGTALLRDSSVFSADVHSTQAFEAGDPIGIAETISKRPWRSTFTFKEELQAVPIEGALLRQAVSRGSFFSREIIRTSIQRIFQTEKKPNANFEDQFLKVFRNHYSRRSYPEGEFIYSPGDVADRFYFILKGAVTLYTGNNAEIGQLGETDFFGERSLLKGVPRGSYARAAQDSTLIVLEADQVRAKMLEESALVRLCILAGLKRMHLMNQLRFSHIFREPIK